jgi:hypothetical protein
VPLAILIRTFVTADEWLARIVGGVIGGVFGAAITYAFVDWATLLGLSTGMFFGTQVSGSVCNPTRRLPPLIVIATTLLLLLSLGVFQSLHFFAEPDGWAFVSAAVAAVCWLLMLVAIRLLARFGPLCAALSSFTNRPMTKLNMRGTNSSSEEPRLRFKFQLRH